MEPEYTEIERRNRLRLERIDGEKDKWEKWFWLPWNYETFKEVLLNTPLRISDLRDFYLGGRTKVNFTSGIVQKGLLQLRGPFNFAVTVLNSQSQIEQGITLVHEAIHAFYRILGGGPFTQNNPIEYEIENYAQNFYRKNIGFVDDLIRRLNPQFWKEKQLRFPFSQNTQLELNL